MANLRKCSRWGGVVVSLGLVLGACVDSGSDESEKRLVTSSEICEGIFSGDVARVLEKTTATHEFFPFEWRSGIAETAESIKLAYAPGGAPGRSEKVNLCLVYRPNSTTPDIEIGFSLSEEKEFSSDGLDLVRYELGRHALAGTEKALLYSECVSPKLGGSSEHPALLRGQLSRDFRSPTPAEETREANLRLLAAATRALARFLQCENDADMPEAPVLRRIS